MKKTIFSLLTCIIIFSLSCKNNSDTVTNGNNPPPTPITGWTTIYEEKAWGTFNCTMPNFCLYDIITDSLDLRNTDSIRILLNYRSYHNTSLEVYKFPNYATLFSFTFPDSTTGKVDRYFNIDYNMKIILDFAFTVENKFTIDTLKVFKKIK